LVRDPQQLTRIAQTQPGPSGSANDPSRVSGQLSRFLLNPVPAFPKVLGVLESKNPK